MKILKPQEVPTVKTLILNLTAQAEQLDDLNIKSDNFGKAIYYLEKLQEEFNQDKENYDY